MFETRTLHESCVYCLALNSIFANAEQGSIRAAATSEQALRGFYEGQMLSEPEVIDGYRYTFKEGPMRNCNPLHGWHHIQDNSMGWNQGWFEHWTTDPDGINPEISRVDF